jgi:hypothetical protein
MQLHQGRLIMNVPSPRIVTVNGRAGLACVAHREFRTLLFTVWE